jgi:hypothetical protein
MKKLFKRFRKWYLCRKHGICPIHNVLRPHGGYNEGTWGACPTCTKENQAKNIHRDTQAEFRRNTALETIDRDWRH